MPYVRKEYEVFFVQQITIHNLSMEDIREAVRIELAEFLNTNSGESRLREKDEMGQIEMAMEITGLARATIYSRCSKRTLPHIKRGKFLYFSRSDLGKWLQEGKRKTREEIAADAERKL